MKVIGVTNCFCLGFETLFHRKVFTPDTKNPGLGRSLVWDGEREGMTYCLAILLNGHVAKQPSKYLCLYRDYGGSQPWPEKQASVCSGQQLMQTLVTGQNADNR